MQTTHLTHPSRAAAAAVHPVARSEHDYDSLLERIGDRRLVLIGESTHGTHEFYRERARITRRLITERGFTAVAVEADWPDAYRVNRFVMGQSNDADAIAALSDFRRFPAWMWRNQDVVEFVQWLRAHNDEQPDPLRRTRFYGLDLYSLRASIEAVIAYLDRVDPHEAARARRRYSCFDHVGSEGQAYGRAIATKQALPCENEVVAQLLSLRQRGESYLERDGWIAADDLFQAEQNALVVRDAEEYYHQMYRAEVSSWNLRDRHMAATLDALTHHLEHQVNRAKVVVWEHNSHVGDARATAMGSRGELNVGQLARQRYGDDSFLIGLTTFHGEVTAASEWGGAVQRRLVTRARSDSHEALLHEFEPAAFWLPTDDPRILELLAGTRLERAIGVIYRPETERQSHYFAARLTEQFDAIVHIDHTSALDPLDRSVLWDRGEPPDTYPTGV
jgi:erythromycin esterase-like protein